MNTNMSTNIRRARARRPAHGSSLRFSFASSRLRVRKTGISVPDRQFQGVVIEPRTNTNMSRAHARARRPAHGSRLRFSFASSRGPLSHSTQGGIAPPVLLSTFSHLLSMAGMPSPPHPRPLSPVARGRGEIRSWLPVRFSFAPSRLRVRQTSSSVPEHRFPSLPLLRFPWRRWGVFPAAVPARSLTVAARDYRSRARGLA